MGPEDVPTLMPLKERSNEINHTKWSVSLSRFTHIFFGRRGGYRPWELRYGRRLELVRYYV